MASIEEILIGLILSCRQHENFLNSLNNANDVNNTNDINNENNANTEIILYSSNYFFPDIYNSDSEDSYYSINSATNTNAGQIEVKLNRVEIGFETKYVRKLLDYNDFVNEFKKLKLEKLNLKIGEIIDITNDYSKYDFYNINLNKETYNNIIYDIKTYYVCELNNENKEFFFKLFDKTKLKIKNKTKYNYALIFNTKNIYIINLKNKIETIISELEKNINQYGTPDYIIDSNEFIEKIKNYGLNNNIVINDLTPQITKLSLDSKIDMIETFINEISNSNTKKCIKYVSDLKKILNELKKDNVYVCKTTINTFYFISMIFDKYKFSYNAVIEPTQNNILIMTSQNNLYIDVLEYNNDISFGINSTRLNTLFENLLKTNKFIECCICYKKTKKNNLCCKCYQFNGCFRCEKKLIEKNIYECVLCKG